MFDQGFIDRFGPHTSVVTTHWLPVQFIIVNFELFAGVVMLNYGGPPSVNDHS